MKRNKGEIIVTILEAVGGLATVAAGIASLFIKDEEDEPAMIEDKGGNDEN